MMRKTYLLGLEKQQQCYSEKKELKSNDKEQVQY